MRAVMTEITWSVMAFVIGLVLGRLVWRRH